ncbi:hypothetical protein VNO80_08231 [Phaseolus coccineus]|uniref:Uncharacterized protein n=1 Tax=Phaseolus coccineus TaxID=3886 RepID=A0AAN9RKK6_PHACN
MPKYASRAPPVQIQSAPVKQHTKTIFHSRNLSRPRVATPNSHHTREAPARKSATAVVITSTNQNDSASMLCSFGADQNDDV